MRYAAATLGWQVQLLDGWGDDDIGAILGVERAEDFGTTEREHPDLMLLLSTAGAEAAGLSPDGLLAAAQAGEWQGQANVLSREKPLPWPVIDQAAAATRKPDTQPASWQAPGLPAPLASACTQSAAALIKQRRSAQRFDGSTLIPAQDFYRMLDMTLPRAHIAPWDAIAWPPRIHLLLFVHRVEGLQPGLYLLVRNDQAEAKLRAELSAEFKWLPVAGCPAHFRFFRLQGGDTQKLARTLSCHQDIVSRGAFSLGMLAEYQASLGHSPWVYRQLFWEAGMLGQVLYLEAEAARVRGTGIGCYFDDEVHELLGINSQNFQSLYHFTVGGAVNDERLQTLAPYAHLQREC